MVSIRLTNLPKQDYMHQYIYHLIRIYQWLLNFESANLTKLFAFSALDTIYVYNYTVNPSILVLNTTFPYNITGKVGSKL